ncbi:TRAP transporter small permease [Microvirga sp. BT688]|uniref:TRAP transporter small permease n=1 Tax=Microvirga sp. TaxID=1873136 RepID=UPI00168828BB|nr:TRAP transporter small permease [Microvirga sp.]MBD2749228.1 TRAP transporter small permease [Microvirga sp.]
MRDGLAALSRILAAINRAALWISGVGLILMTVFVGWQVFGRYVLNQSPSWTEPASLLLMSWFILLGSAVGVREGNHLGFEIGLHYAPPGLRRLMLGVTEVLVFVFGAAMAWYGTELAVETWSAAMPGLPIPQGFDYVPLAFGGALIALFSLEKFVRLLSLGEDVPLVRVDEPHLVAVKD